MSPTRLSDQQVQQPFGSKASLPTMYDLPSEDPNDPGLPDEFHDLQPQLLSATFRIQDYPSGEIFTGTDLNVYYDPEHLQWYKRPDWFVAIGVPRLYQEKDMRLSYVVWQEQVNPAVVVELLSPGTEQEDLGGTVRSVGQPPTKWEVYEQILKVPHYIVYDRYSTMLRAFQLKNEQYQEQVLTEPKVWLPDLKIGLGLWEGMYDRVPAFWLRWFDASGDWILTDAECDRQQRILAEQQRDLAEQQRVLAEQHAEALAQRLRELGLEP
jgi:Uma2 family endonuclease